MPFKRSQTRSRLTLFASSLLAASCLAAAPAHAQSFPDVKPSPQQVRWQDLEMGAIIHFGTNTFLDREWGDGTASPSVFNPTNLDTDQWMAAAKSAGIRYVVQVAKHHDGFALWPTAQSDYSVKASPWLGGKGDVIRMASDSARKAGLLFGVYESPWDRHDPRYKDPAAYDAFYLGELEELAEVENAAEGAGKTLAEWLRELALKAARERPADPTELLLAEVSALRYMLLNLFHATAQANAEGKHLLPDSVVKIRDQANVRKLADARKLLAEFLSQEGLDGGKQ